MKISILSIIKVTLLIVSFLPANALSFVKDITLDGISYSLYDNHTCAISWGKGASGRVSIPATVNYNDEDYSVTSIRDFAFEENGSIRSVVIGNNIRRIGYGAFDNSGLEAVVIPHSVKYIDYNAFIGCKNLITISIPSSVEEIGGLTCQGCSKLEHAYFDAKSLGNGTFSYVDNLRTLTLGESVEEIEDYFAWECPNLTAITSLASVPPKFGAQSEEYENYLDIMNNCVLYVPAESIDDYANAVLWRKCKSILPLSEKPSQSVLYIQFDKTHINGMIGEDITIQSFVSPLDATNPTLAYSSSDETIATVNQNGQISLLKKGTVVITASATDGSGVTAECEIIVGDQSGVDEILIDKDSYVKVYDLNGNLIFEGIYFASNLNKGIYIISHDGKMQKVMIK